LVLPQIHHGQLVVELLFGQDDARLLAEWALRVIVQLQHAPPPKPLLDSSMSEEGLVREKTPGRNGSARESALFRRFGGVATRAATALRRATRRGTSCAPGDPTRRAGNPSRGPPRRARGTRRGGDSARRQGGSCSAGDTARGSGSRSRRR